MMLMKNFKYYSLFTLLLCNLSFVAISAPDSTAPEDSATNKDSKESSQETFGYESLSPEMNLLISQSEFLKDRFDTCKKTSNNNEISTCMTENLETGQIAEIQKKLDEIRGNQGSTDASSRKPASTDSKDKKNPAKNSSKDKKVSIPKAGEEELRYEGRDRLAARTKVDPAVKKIQEYFHEKLKEALYNDYAKTGSDKDFKAVPQGAFFDMFKTQLGKNIISSFSSYCMEADRTNFKIDDKAAAKTNRIDNIKLLSDNPEKAKETFNKCITNVAVVCHEKVTDNTKTTYTQERACEVIDQVKAARQMLIATDKIKAQYNKVLGGSEDKDEGHNVKIDKVTTLTSKEVATESGFDKEVKAQQKILEKCQTDPENKECDQFIADAKKETALVSEYAIKTTLHSKKIDNLKKEDIVSYLQEQGYTKVQIKELLKDDSAVKTLKEEIFERYKSEKKSLIARMNKRLEKTTVNINSKDTKEDRAKILKNKLEESKARILKMKQNIYFTNIASSYLQIKDQNNKTKSNNRAMKAEMENSSFDPENNKDSRGPSSSQENMDVGFKNLKLEKGDSEEEKAGESNSSTTLNVDNINSSLLKHSGQKSDKKKKEQ